MKRYISLLLSVLFSVISPAGAFAQNPVHQVALSWSAPVTTLTITGYNVYRVVGACPTSPSLSAFTKLTTVTGVAYTDTTVTTGSTYCYTVTAVSAGAEGGMPGTIQVTIPTFTAINIPPPVGNLGGVSQ